MIANHSFVTNNSTGITCDVILGPPCDDYLI